MKPRAVEAFFAWERNPNYRTLAQLAGEMAKVSGCLFRAGKETKWDPRSRSFIHPELVSLLGILSDGVEV